MEQEIKGNNFFLKMPCYMSLLKVVFIFTLSSNAFANPLKEVLQPKLYDEDVEFLEINLGETINSNMRGSLVIENYEDANIFKSEERLLKLYKQSKKNMHCARTPNLVCVNKDSKGNIFKIFTVRSFGGKMNPDTMELAPVHANKKLIKLGNVYGELQCERVTSHTEFMKHINSIGGPIITNECKSKASSVIDVSFYLDMDAAGADTVTIYELR